MSMGLQTMSGCHLKGTEGMPTCCLAGAGDRDRTGDIQLGKLAFYR